MGTKRPPAPFLLVILLAVALAAPAFAAPRTVHLPAGSVDGLAAAIEEAGPGGTVLVRRGLHFESSTVEIHFSVNIVGRHGAILEFDSAPHPDPAVAFAVRPALHIRDADFVTIRRLELRPAGVMGNTAILIENADGARIQRNRITDFQMGVLIHQGDGAEVTRNVISAGSDWDAVAHPGPYGIVNLNGEFVRITGNRISGETFGILVSDRNGHAGGNVLSDSYVGVILCRVLMSLEISGNFVSSDHVADGWTIHRNLAINSSHAAFMVADGACFNELHDNAARGTIGYDVELLGDSCFLGALTPTSFENQVMSASREALLVRDCGYSNLLDGLLEISQDACVPRTCMNVPHPREDPAQPRRRTRE